ncbi:MAG: acetate kinase, partial [Clostridia bacterium]|nr:acetate kinase [Clostridia bacterium]
GGKCFDTSIGLTPLEGVMMGTRCGSIDPAIVPFLMEREGWTPAQADAYMNKQCGFLGVSGISSDSRDIEAAILKGDKNAYRAASTLAYQIKKYIGSYTAAMNGLDAIVWTAGMGENNPEVRERACSDLEFLGVKINKELNATVHHQPNTVEISTPDSKVKVYVLPTNEELMIASDTEAIVSKL